MTDVAFGDFARSINREMGAAMYFRKSSADFERYSGLIALISLFVLCGTVTPSVAACAAVMCGPGSGSSSGSSPHGGHHGGLGAGGLIGIGIGVGAIIGSEAARQTAAPAPERAKRAKAQPEKRHTKTAAVAEGEVCSAEDIVPVTDWEKISPSPVPELTSLRYPDAKEKYLVFDDGTVRCIAGAWKLWVYHQLKALPWPYDKQPIAATGKKLSAYSIDQVAPEIRRQDGPQFGLTTQEMSKLLNCSEGAKILLIFRASKAASLKYHNDPNYMPKPAEYYVTDEGTYTRDKNRRSEKDSAPRSTKYMHSDGTGIIQEKPGKPLKIDNKLVFSDLDPQNAFQKGPSGMYQQASTDADFVDRMTACLGYELVTHGGEGWYRGQ